ncbi:alpha/beta fold hydrolase [Amycolatopsis decaplanina]|uniref:Putative hydrolase or acyltransferase n=1 Tax=Amycolatopsis decaplanina DSM 44594 TaxID=1284240 RepID=M2ZAY7_9PSEU|nr:alpha/beta fold hydrolase [Amycolatopsis decaplanina]EME64517.1 putative hydrolase or acyltransferase [Amycolatopsis decaplanina DSM 44594]
MPRSPIGDILDVNGAAVHVRQDGAGPPLLLLHGYCGSVHWFDRLTLGLSAGHHVIRVDLLGHGCTGGSSGASGLDAVSQARMVAAVLDALGVEDVLIAGHSFGADVALALAAISPRAGSLVLIGQAPDYGYASFPPGSPVLLPIVSTLVRRIAHRRWVRFASRFRRGVLFDDPLQDLADHAVTAPAMARVVLVERARLLAARPLDEQVADLALPCLVILGRRDRFYDCEKTFARYSAAGARVEVVEGAGHSPFLERPAEVARLLREFRA